jgi:hypothetical protein
MLGKKQENQKEFVDRKSDLYNPKLAKDGKFNSTIRMLPCRDDEETNIALHEYHMVQSPSGKWFGFDCFKRQFDKCPICELSKAIYKADKDKAKEFKQKKSFYTNVLVVKDTTDESNVGKVFKFKFGNSIAQKIRDRSIDQKTEDDEGNTKVIEGCDVYDLKKGTDFIYKADTKVVSRYADSRFLGVVKPIHLEEELTKKEIEAVLEKVFPLKEMNTETFDGDYDKLLEIVNGRFEKKFDMKIDDYIAKVNGSPKENLDLNKEDDEDELPESKSSKTSSDEFFDDLL